jgi:Bacterial sugar transferase
VQFIHCSRASSAGAVIREHVPPGITGLWQVEARDNPSFEAYRRLDLFYVENWSLVFDLMIVLATVEQIAVRVLRAVFPRGGGNGSSDDTPVVIPIALADDRGVVSPSRESA